MTNGTMILIALALGGLIFFFRKYRGHLAEGYFRISGYLLAAVLVAAPFLFLLMLGTYGFSAETLISDDGMGPMTAVVIFELFVAVRLLLRRLRGGEPDGDHVPYFSREGNEGMMTVTLFAVPVLFLLLILSDLPMFFAFLELCFGVYFLIAGSV